MVDFIKSNWSDIIQIIISLVVGFIGGKTYTDYSSKKVKQTSKIKGNNNNVDQRG